MRKELQDLLNDKAENLTLLEANLCHNTIKGKKIRQLGYALAPIFLVGIVLIGVFNPFVPIYVNIILAIAAAAGTLGTAKFISHLHKYCEIHFANKQEEAEFRQAKGYEKIKKLALDYQKQHGKKVFGHSLEIARVAAESYEEQLAKQSITQQHIDRQKLYYAANHDAKGHDHDNDILNSF